MSKTLLAICLLLVAQTTLSASAKVKSFGNFRRILGSDNMAQYCPQGKAWFAKNCNKTESGSYKTGFVQGCEELKGQLDQHCQERRMRMPDNDDQFWPRRLQSFCGMYPGWKAKNCTGDGLKVGEEKCKAMELRFKQKC